MVPGKWGVAFEKAVRRKPLARPAASFSQANRKQMPPLVFRSPRCQVTLRLGRYGKQP